MRRIPHALRRGWLVTAAAILVALPVGAPAAVAAPARLPHPVGGYAPGTVRTPARVLHGGLHATDALPASVDLREFAPKPGDQGQIGSCVAWTIAYSVMGYYANRTGGVGAPYAPLFLYMRNVEPGRAPSAGLYPDSVLANAAAAGVDTQDDYWQGTTNYQTPPTPAQIANAKNYRVAGWARLFNGANQGTGAQTAIKQALAAGSPVALGIPVYRDFMYLGQHSLYGTLSGTSLGGHMLTAYGYDAQGVWIRNSWGTSWGNAGDAKLSWGFINMAAIAAYTVAGISTPATPPAKAPAVSALSPDSVRTTGGATVTLSGTDLTGVTSVKVGTSTVPASGVSATALSFVAPAHAAGPVAVTVSNTVGTSTQTVQLKYTNPPAPAVTSVTPSSGPANKTTPVTLTGTELAGATRVTAGGVTVPFVKVSATQLDVTLPARAAGVVALQVTTPNGVSSANGGSTFTYQAPVPTITGVTPRTGLTYVSTPVVVTGENLGDATKLTLDGVSVPFTKVSSTQLKATLPAHAAGEVNLQVTAPGGLSALGSAARYGYLAPPVPVVAAVTPPTGTTTKSTTVVLTGTAFGGATKVTANGISVPFVKVADSQIRVTLAPRAAGAIPLVVTTPGGASAAATFTYVAPATAGKTK